ncbi:hypothetical protein K7432_017631 [Basidiobolus ranarum]|uniref:Uncharacterized protein n=1 Tax=Basidiobolus ranarum TaxID=34480 RepID=A0ABR2VK49_9FUNG
MRIHYIPVFALACINYAHVFALPNRNFEFGIALPEQYSTSMPGQSDTHVVNNPNSAKIQEGFNNHPPLVQPKKTLYEDSVHPVEHTAPPVPNNNHPVNVNGQNTDETNKVPGPKAQRIRYKLKQKADSVMTDVERAAGNFAQKIESFINEP